LTRIIRRVFRNPRRIIAFIVRYCYFLSDETVIKVQYWAFFKKKLNIINPRTFNEKLQWAKLFDRNPQYTQLADKFAAREYIKAIIGEQYTVPLFGVWERFEDIDFDNLPNRFVLKCNHDYNSVFLCRDKSQLNKRKARQWFNKKLRRNHYWVNREWQYKNIVPKIIAEQYLEDKSKSLMDYKVHCFNGEPKLVQVDFDRFTAHGRNIYSPKWEFLDFSYNYPNDKNRIINKPDRLDDILYLTNKIANLVKVAYLRIDWYNIESEIYIGEFTFIPVAGLGLFAPESYDEILGSWIKLPNFKPQEDEND
jgi:hypothetical protein